MLGAYSLLRDPSYAKDLTNGMMPKLGVALTPEVKAVPQFHFRSPDVIGTGALSRPGYVPGEMSVRPPKVDAAQSPGPNPTNVASHAMGAMGALGQMPKRPIPGIGVATDVAELAGLPEAFSGREARPWRDVADQHLQSMDPGNWAQGFKDIYQGNTNSPLPAWAQYGVHAAFNNPGMQAISHPVQTPLALYKLFEDAATATHRAWSGPEGGGIVSKRR